MDKKERGESLTCEDIVAIQQLNARYALALDGLVEDAAARWVDTFADDGVFSIVDANGRPVVPEVRGSAALAGLYQHFSDIASTRHWYNNLLIEPDPKGATMTCYIVAVGIGQFPATIERSGLYRDRLVKIDGNWKFQARLLILDPGSTAGGR